MLNRRDFLKLSGALGLTALLGGSLVGCSNGNAEDETTENTKQIEGAVENEYWIPTGNKETFETEKHLIYEISCCDGGYGRVPDWFYNNEIKIPDGYAYVSSEPITRYYSEGSKTYGIKYNYINIVPVEVLEYQNTETGEVAYPFAGTPLDLEKAQSASKVYRKTM